MHSIWSLNEHKMLWNTIENELLCHSMHLWSLKSRNECECEEGLLSELRHRMYFLPEPVFGPVFPASCSGSGCPSGFGKRPSAGRQRQFSPPLSAAAVRKMRRKMMHILTHSDRCYFISIIKEMVEESCNQIGVLMFGCNISHMLHVSFIPWCWAAGSTGLVVGSRTCSAAGFGEDGSSLPPSSSPPPPVHSDLPQQPFPVECEHRRTQLKIRWKAEQRVCFKWKKADIPTFFFKLIIVNFICRKPLFQRM